MELSGGEIVGCSDPGDALKVYPERKYIILHSVAPPGKTIMEITIDHKTETAKSRRVIESLQKTLLEREKYV